MQYHTVLVEVIMETLRKNNVNCAKTNEQAKEKYIWLSGLNINRFHTITGKHIKKVKVKMKNQKLPHHFFVSNPYACCVYIPLQ